ncbi:DHH family phosphoesterase [Natronobacterium gregoryi]|uniref:Bifunctional oligoribonuclease/PAP phosphatase NrnA n=2 Tax=Natronobacterium gregoryi TaxID=44930 RepID=L0AMM2_NATGS|nr:bifunctional oligoribonuclease/PAP phosphatase NrnA [Natronobacterium gregoryi]AFZ74704.1 exopolyphosphatase-like enzyme [Natronobacterium gregoryi SP2]ELY73391.1 phosphoesterase RecJ domain-containing protein [Natronobacterium gregoryi SP2]PLK20948.1 bifunctional oligoribonuclease/PAP phosphatase NrnA [Natronobacterium gregoryi SP2]SFJ04471.1 nanoRNase/pAp phosphatase, hydrolyzes c-di-AMP and oligoRNAs [Natronobacterium gregoryi]
MSRAAELVEVLETADSLVIVCHDNPDPDCLASALALEAIALDHSLEDVAIVYGGDLTHQQNRAFVNVFSLSLGRVSEVAVDDYDCLAFVDHSRSGVNTEVPANVVPDIVVDHHPVEPAAVPVADIRTEYGATATIFVEYLAELDVELTTRLASALLFALHRERLDFVRSPTRREYEAALALFPDADLEILGQLYDSAFSPGTLDAIGRAIASRKRRGSSMVASVGKTAESAAIPQAADYLLNLEGVDTVLVYGIVDGRVRLSGRSIDPRVHVGEVLTEGFDGIGTAGGHPDMAGGRIELGLFGDEADDTEQLLSLVDSRLTRRFFDALNLERENRQQ